MNFNFPKNSSEIDRLSKISNFFEIAFIISLVMSAVLGSSNGWISLCFAIFCGAAGTGLTISINRMKTEAIFIEAMTELRKIT